MRSAKVTDFGRCRSDAGGRSRPPGGSRWRQAGAGLVFAAAVACLAQDGRPAANPAPGDGAAAQAPAATLTTPQAETVARPTTPDKATGVEGMRKKQISDESTQLLAMAMALKAEVDKTNKDVLSLNVIRKADEIEKLAHTVKERIKQASGPG